MALVFRLFLIEIHLRFIQRKDIDGRHQVGGGHLIGNHIFIIVISKSIVIFQIFQTFRIKSLQRITLDRTSDDSLLQTLQLLFGRCL